MKKNYQKNQIEAGVDEAGRGALAGPVVAAAVILNANELIVGIDDSKKLTVSKRKELDLLIRQKSICFSIAVSNERIIEKVNILNATFIAMHKAISKLKKTPELLLIDGNKFTPYPTIEHINIIKGDQKYLSIAAASILAKVYRDKMMLELNSQFPAYEWHKNKGYPTLTHRKMIEKYGVCVHHRKTFRLTQ